MIKKTVSVIVTLFVLFGLLIYLIIAPEKENKEIIELKSTKEEVLTEINKTKEYVKKTSEWMEADTGESDIGYYNPPHDENSNRDQKKDVVKYFIAGLMTNDVDIFLSSFYPQTISEDLFKSKVQDKTKVAEDIMNQITRSGRLKEIQYADRKGIFNSKTDKLSLTFIYNDNKQAKVTLHVLPVQDSHHEHEENIFVITTSAWLIIEQIENST
ncbi:hypothetical protein C0966_17335 (plasmid) [Bacillus methanolicus]|uniref:hypothetical protein n=1 Tax=Bacillus methanolicus TaxID=1471 RepID=UPI0023800885|nr:hypothetical protein [Bacillus methanolicus]MDE3841029.1 hypothetical protein [Bacillus methanolicus]